MAMRQVMVLAVCAAMAGFVGCTQTKHEGHEGMAEGHHEMMWASVDKAVAVIYPTKGNTVSGTLTFMKMGDGVHISGTVTGLAPSSVHAMHIHEFGDQSSDDGMAAGGHYNPEHHDHGAPTDANHHAGDLGNITADASGKATIDMMVQGISIAGMKDPIIGRGVVIHAKPDDFGQPVGNAGGRIGVGVIGIAKRRAGDDACDEMTFMTKLSVNINKVATLRNTRALGIPSVVGLSRIALQAGAAGITIHPRPDQRHIRLNDVAELSALWKEFPRTEFNIEGNPFFDYMPHVRAVRPTQCTLVPDTTEAFTSDHGWTLTTEERAKLRPLIAEMKSLGCRVSLFMDADAPAMEAARELGADRVELYTEPYAAAFARGGEALEGSLKLYAEGARRAAAAGLGINAGHDLNLANLPPFLARVQGVDEVSIGHALIADALEFGMAATVKKYLAACAAG